MGQPAERLRDNGNKKNKWKQETEDYRETADHLLPIDTRSTRQPRIGHGRTSRQIPHYLNKQNVTGQYQIGDGQGRQHHGRPQQTSVHTTEDGTGAHEEQNQTDHNRFPHNNNCHVNYTQYRKQEQGTTTWTVRTETGQQGRKRRKHTTTSGKKCRSTRTHTGTQRKKKQELNSSETSCDN
jgi:hypothetical protein